MNNLRDKSMPRWRRFARWCPPLPRWSLRGMIGLCAAVGVMSAIWSSANYASREASFARQLQQRGFTVLTARMTGGPFRWAVSDEEDLYVASIYLDVDRFDGSLVGERAQLVGSHTWENIRRCQHVNYLGLAYSDVDTDAILSLRSQPQSLDLTGTDVDDRLLRELADFANQCKLIRLKNTQVTDEGLRHWNHCTSLREFAVGGPQISDAGISQLCHCRNLARIAVSGRQVCGTFLHEFRHAKTLERLSIDDCPNFDLGNLKYLKEIQSPEFDIACKPAALPIECIQQSSIRRLTILWDAQLDEADQTAIETLKANTNRACYPDGIRYVVVKPTN